jgi:hypothetical protein
MNRTFKHTAAKVPEEPKVQDATRRAKGGNALPPGHSWLSLHQTTSVRGVRTEARKPDLHGSVAKPLLLGRSSIR